MVAMKAAILAGPGIERQPESNVKQELANGNLVRVLPDWSLPVSQYYAVWPVAGHQDKLIWRFVEFLRTDGQP